MAFIYLASPYSHGSKTVRHARYLHVMEVAANYLKQGVTVYSPMVHCHELAIRFEMPKGFDMWKIHNENMLLKSCGVYVLKLNGWELSQGVRGEVKFAKELGKPIEYLEYEAAKS